MRGRFWTTLGAVLLGWFAYFQTARAMPQPIERALPSPFLITRWTTENGLPQNSVAAIVQTPDGYLWLGTFGGLVRFDGVKFTVFSSVNTPALRSTRINTLHMGRSGTLWIGTDDGEVMTYRQGAFHAFRRFEKVTAGGINMRKILRQEDFRCKHCLPNCCT